MSLPPPKLIFCGLAVFFVSIFASVAPTASTDHIVGADKGWSPGINFTRWVNNQIFYVNDFISFRYQKTQYYVLEVNRSGYDKCTAEGTVGNWSSGEDLIPLTQAKRYYFICGNAGQCFHGMKLSILAHPLPPPPRPPPSEADPLANKSSSWPSWTNLARTIIFIAFLSYILVFFILFKNI